jgi:hypothetical protein
MLSWVKTGIGTKNYCLIVVHIIDSLRNHPYLIHYMFRPLWVILRCYQLYDIYHCITT